MNVEKKDDQPKSLFGNQLTKSVFGVGFEQPKSLFGGESTKNNNFFGSITPEATSEKPLTSFFMNTSKPDIKEKVQDDKKLEEVSKTPITLSTGATAFTITPKEIKSDLSSSESAKSEPAGSI